MKAGAKRSWMDCRLLAVLMIGGVLSSGGLASALENSCSSSDPGCCIQDIWEAHGNTQGLTCTANDVRVAEALNICAPDPQTGDPCCEADGCTPTCVEGSTFTFTAEFKVVLTAQTRYDIGVYFASDGGNGDGALTGECELNTIDGPPNQNTDDFINLDASPDVCGDIKNTSQFNPQFLSLEVTALCEGTEENPDQVNLPNCTSWRQSGANEVCDEATDAFPGSPSKCNCQPLFPIDIFIEPAVATVTKTATKACVTYDVDVTNPTTTHTLTLNSLSDDKFGNVADASNTSLCSTDCVVPQTLDPGETYSCSFEGNVPSASATCSEAGTPDGGIHSNQITAALTDDDDNPLSAQGIESVIVDLTIATP